MNASGARAEWGKAWPAGMSRFEKVSAESNSENVLVLEVLDHEHVNDKRKIHCIGEFSDPLCLNTTSYMPGPMLSCFPRHLDPETM